MRVLGTMAAAAALGCMAPAAAQLEPFTDYEVSDAVWVITTVKVDANMDDFYLEGLRATWVESNEIAKELGHIEDYAILQSALPQSGDFNLMLAVRFESMAALGPSRERYDAFMEAWGTANQDNTEQIARSYPEMREITGEYIMHELTMLDPDAPAAVAEPEAEN
ncbi:MAG: hypothetical protein AAFX03_05690 [Pseudomonadota bacterium]